MEADVAKLTAAILLAQTQPGVESPVVEWGLVGLIAWLVIRECFGLARKILELWKGKSDCRNCEELVKLRVEVAHLQARVEEMIKP